MDWQKSSLWPRHTCFLGPWTLMEPQTCVSAAAAVLEVATERSACVWLLAIEAGAYRPWVLHRLQSGRQASHRPDCSASVGRCRRLVWASSWMQRLPTTAVLGSEGVLRVGCACLHFDAMPTVMPLWCAPTKTAAAVPNSSLVRSTGCFLHTQCTSKHQHCSCCRIAGQQCARSQRC